MFKSELCYQYNTFKIKLSGLNCRLICIVSCKGFLVGLVQNITTTIIIPSLLRSVAPSSDASIEQTSIPSVVPKDTMIKPSVEPFTVPVYVLTSNTQSSAEPSHVLSSNAPTVTSVKKQSILKSYVGKVPVQITM